MMLDIDGIFTQHQATINDVLTAAQAIAVSAIGNLVNNSLPTDSNDNLHRLADGIANQIRTALHLRINEGIRTDW